MEIPPNLVFLHVTVILVVAVFLVVVDLVVCVDLIVVNVLLHLAFLRLSSSRSIVGALFDDWRFLRFCLASSPHIPMRRFQMRGPCISHKTT